MEIVINVNGHGLLVKSDDLLYFDIGIIFDNIECDNIDYRFGCDINNHMLIVYQLKKYVLY